MGPWDWDSRVSSGAGVWVVRCWVLLFSYCVDIVELSLAFGLCVEGLTPTTSMSILDTERSKASPIRI